MNEYSKNRVTVDLAALTNNYKILQEKAGGRNVLAMIKADAYGHGMVRCAKALAECGCRFFGIAELGEGIALRKAGIEDNILVFLGVSPGWFHLVPEYELTPVMGDEKIIRNFMQWSLERRTEVSIHLKVDTGMSRLGVGMDRVGVLLDLAEQNPFFTIEGVVSHLAAGDEQENVATEKAIELFQNMREEYGSRIHYIHLANSGGILFHQRTHFDFVRAGISLYGYYPDGSPHDLYEEEHRLRPVLRFASEVIQVKTIEAGQGISYGHTYVTDRETKVAVLPVGYEDGLSRSLSNKGEVLIRGSRAPILGRICMNLTMVDVSNIGEVCVGDEAVFIGRQQDEEITADHMAALAGTISYEVLCMIGNNNNRSFIR